MPRSKMSPWWNSGLKMIELFANELSGAKANMVSDEAKLSHQNVTQNMSRCEFYGGTKFQKGKISV